MIFLESFLAFMDRSVQKPLMVFNFFCGVIDLIFEFIVKTPLK
jgi:hypothetical protein